MARVTPQEFAEKWARRTTQATEDYEHGIRRVQTPPGQQAAQQKALYLSRVQEKAETWAQRTGAVSLAEWQGKAISKGKGRISQGVEGAKQDVASMATGLLTAVDAASAAARSKPKATLEDRIARSVEFQRQMARYKK
jgi:hypothetical protein